MSVIVVDHGGAARFCNYGDPAIKLFGRDIPLSQETSEESLVLSNVQVQNEQPDQMPHARSSKEPMDIVSCEPENSACVETGSNSMASSSVKVGESPVINGVPVHSTLPKVEESQCPLAEKSPKKPDKVLPCPRCHSLDTKFCYFNNYNVNQPRHFCRKCQRYWTAGGTLRNVPVGAGRRKNKHSASHQKHVMVSDALPMRTCTSDMGRHRFASTNVAQDAKTLSNLTKPRLHVLPLEAQPVSTMDSPSASSNMTGFGRESPLCRSMAAATLDLQENGSVENHGRLSVDGSVAAKVFVLGGKHAPEPDTCASSSEMLPPSCQTSVSPCIPEVTAGVQVQEGELTVDVCDGNKELQAGEVASSMHGASWQPHCNIVPKCPFNPTTADSQNNSSTGLSVPLPNVLATNGSAGAFWPGFTWPYMNPALWGAPPMEWAGPWSMPVYPPGIAAAAAAAAALLPYSGAGSGAQRHQLPEHSQPEKCLWVPKTLRIDDPLNAARSSIWTTLGLGDGPLSSPVHGFANRFQTKSDTKDENEAVNSSRLSNPAALSRSAAFHENG